MTSLMGRPRDYDREVIAEELLKWAQLPDSINLNAFCSEYLLPPSKLSHWAKECDNFRQSYELAKTFLGNRRERLLNLELLHVKAYDLNAANYDYFLKEEKRMQAEYEASLKKEETSTPTKVVFEVNYGNGNQVEILPKALPITDPSSS